MTAKRSYECNLCKMPIVGDRLGRGVEFGPNRINWVTCLQAENHLCDDCVHQLMAAFRQAPPVTAVSTTGESK